LAERLGAPFHVLASTILSRLNVPPAILSPLTDFFMPGVEDQTTTARGNLSRLLNLANLCAHALLLAPTVNEVVRPPRPTEYGATLGASPEQFDLDALESEIAVTARALLGNATQLKKPLATPQRIRALYLGDGDVTGPDPLKILLQHLLTDLVADFVNGAAESLSIESVSAFDAVVIASGSDRTAAAVAALASSPRITTPILYLTSGWPAAIAPPAAVQVMPPTIKIDELRQFLENAATTARGLAA
jgi:hypothetical protein